MKFNKDSKLMKISAYGQGYYSSAEAYGEIFIPYETYLKNKDALKNKLSVYVGELDGKHSEVECDIEFEEWSISDILKTRYESYKDGEDIDEDVYHRVCSVLKLSNEQGLELNNFNSKLWELDKFYEYEDVEVILKDNTEIQNVIVPKGTKINFTQKSNNVIPNNWEFEYKLSL